MDDINELGDILTQSFHNPVGMTFWLYPLLKLGVCEDLRTRFRSSTPNYVCLVAIKPMNKLTGESEKIVGTVELSVRSTYYWHLRKKYTYIANLAVSHSFRRKGVAHQLLLKCEQIANSWGFENINLHVLENNHQAKQLYLKNGYKIHQIESSLSDWLTRSPRRLFLQKSL
jgi:ribosomal protein S18 acetylase RimI-like enzyme